MRLDVNPILDSLQVLKISDEEYFSEKYSKEYISNSRLSIINPEQDNNPRGFFVGLNAFPKFSDSLLLGSSIHQLCLQPEYFHLCTTVNRPSGKAGFMADELFPFFTDESVSKEKRLKAIYDASEKVLYYKNRLDEKKITTLLEKCRPYWRDRLAYEKKLNKSTPIYLDPKLRSKVNACMDSINSNGMIQSLLHPKGLVKDPISMNEQAILLDIEVRFGFGKPFILKLKAKLDNFTIDTESNSICVNDLKTIGNYVNKFPRNAEIYHYTRELAFYSYLLSLVAKKLYDMKKFTIRANCLVVSTIDFETMVFQLSQKNFVDGFSEVRRLLKLVAEYYDAGCRFV